MSLSNVERNAKISSNANKLCFLETGTVLDPFLPPSLLASKWVYLGAYIALVFVPLQLNY